MRRSHIACTALLLFCLAPVIARAGETVRISGGTGALESNGASHFPTVSANGRYVAFQSLASNLVPNDTNNTYDIFVYDGWNGTTERVSVASDGTQADDGSFNAMISADGRYVTFESYATNLVADDTNGWPDIFVHDRQTGLTERVSLHTDGTEPDDQCTDPDITPDGRYVVFMAKASNLVTPPVTNDDYDIYIRDRLTNTTERVSVASDGTGGNGRSSHPAVSDDGRFVSFYSYADNLIASDTNNVADVFLRDRLTGQTVRVSLDSNGQQATNRSFDADLSPDGSLVVFQSWAPLVADDMNGAWDIYLRDMAAGTIERISVDDAGLEANGASVWESISEDGRFVAFTSQATNLVPGDTNAVQDVFLRDRLRHRTTRLSVSSDGVEADAMCFAPIVARDGRTVVFASNATNLIPDDTNNRQDVFLHHPFAVADRDGDGDVDLTDYAAFLTCYNGPAQPPGAPGCDPTDFDHDGDVDLSDYGTFLACFNGPGVPPAATCPPAG
jgi:Tol biopolymer transport system component